MTSQDTAEIIAVTVRYCWALDQRRFEDLAQVFTPECHADYGADHIMTSPQEIGGFFAKVLDLRGVDRCQHLVANHEVVVDGDTATSRCQYQSHYLTQTSAGAQVEDVGGMYVDSLRRTPDGWRIAKRVVRTNWRLGGPDPSASSTAQNASAFIVAGGFSVDPERRADVLAATRDLRAALQDEPGILDYSVTADEEPGAVRVFTRWRSESDLRRHVADPRVQEHRKALGEAGFRDARLRRFTVGVETPALIPDLPINA
ncbi:nuclear transport factor 2 family protein [Actinocorallia sp. A-T 12471]|uniref:nuclear transport factor 2 family protein n=1 Tax=Actinocorallia sp. A-T 12471 TaxID=3089813 RepID=UPI0029D1CD40|nr:nuclear transport factor 2 family protein [Actinocorallia sp. A-T 12471]MDX6739867.1 nuclear transport factor 2 family protein [Actinocorallia sp. A-T 12471]